MMPPIGYITMQLMMCGCVRHPVILAVIKERDMRLNNLTDLANLLRSLDNDILTDGIGFDMRFSYDDKEDTDLECGSACCIGGWVQHCNPETRSLSLVLAVATLLPHEVRVRRETWDELEELCYPEGYEEAWDATPQQAARAVEILRDTGKCDWDRAMREVAA
jgi:hypothetical protein